MAFILGKKLGMSQMFNKEKEVVPVTVIEAGPCPVVAIKNKEKDGYEAIQLAFGKVAERKINRPQRGHQKKAGLNEYYKYLVEFKNNTDKIFMVGELIDVSVFKEGDILKVSGTAKAKGFQGVVKRHGFGGGPASHGDKHSMRAPGSIGMSFPERVPKGRRMAGRMGGGRISVRGLKIAQVDKENNLLMIKGAVPGAKGTILEIIKIKDRKIGK